MKMAHKKETERHPRYRVFNFQEGHSHHAGAPQALKAILFRHNSNLRSHALKHCGNLMEIEASGRGRRADLLAVVAAVDALKDLGCPFLIYHLETPPCGDGQTRCGLYEQCGAICKPLEEQYLALCEALLVEAGETPRNVALSGTKGTQYYWAYSDQNHLAKLVLQKDAYNVMTCFAVAKGKNATKQEKLLEVIRTVNKEAVGDIAWANPQTWGISVDTNVNGEDTSENPRRKRTGKKVMPYARQKGGWRRHLDYLDD